MKDREASIPTHSRYRLADAERRVARFREEWPGPGDKSPPPRPSSGDATSRPAEPLGTRPPAPGGR